MGDKKISFWSASSIVCTCFGIGKIPFASGTFGSLLGLLYFNLHYKSYEYAANNDVFKTLKIQIDYTYSLVDLLFGFIIGAYFANKYYKRTAIHDSKEIIIDEVVGQFLTCLLAFFYILKPADITNYYLGLFICFITFRFFDILKPFPISWIDKNVKGGFGVMLDDIFAGIAAGVTSALILMLI